MTGIGQQIQYRDCTSWPWNVRPGCSTPSGVSGRA